MSIFCSKNLKRPPRLSDMFRQSREQSGWDFRNLQARTHIPKKYLSSLETGKFETLPKARAHRIAYVKEYAAALGLDPETCVEQFFKEEGLKDVSIATSVRPKHFPFGSLSILIRNLILGTLVTGFAAFLIFQVKNILEPPSLSIINPVDGYITSEKILTLEGISKSGAPVTLNGQEVSLDKNNHFRVRLDLVSGLNTLEIEAKKKHGKMTKKVVNVIVKQSAIGMNN